MFVGTPQYASPEQLAGAPVDARTDLFSAAVVTFEMLAGRPPFSGATLPALAHAVTLRGAAGPHRRGGGRRRRPHPASRPGQGAGRSLSHGAGVRRRSAGGAGAGRQRTDGRGAADPAPGRAAVPAAQAGCRDRLPRSQPRRCAGQFTVRARVAGRAIDAQVGALCPAAARSGPAGHRPGRGRRAGRDAAGDRRAACASAPSWSPRRPATSGGRTSPTRRPTRCSSCTTTWPGRSLPPCRSAGATAARRRPAPPTRRRSSSISAACSCAPRPARCARRTPSSSAAWSAIPSSRRPGPSAAGSSACSASSRIRRCAPRRRPRSVGRWPSTPTAPPPRYYLAQLGDRPRPGRRFAGPAARSRLAAPRRAAGVRGAGARLPLLRAARRLGRRAPRRRPARSRRWPAACCTPTTSSARGARRSTSCTAAAIPSRDGCSRRWDAATRPSPPPGARKNATPRSPCCAAFATAIRAGLEGDTDDRHRGDGAVRRPALQRRRDVLLRRRGLRARRRHRAGLRDARSGRGRRLPVAAGVRERHLPGAAAQPRRLGAAGRPAAARRRRRRRRCSTSVAGACCSGCDAARSGRRRRARATARAAARPWRTSSRASRSRPTRRARQPSPPRSTRRSSAAPPPGPCARPRRSGLERVVQRHQVGSRRIGGDVHRRRAGRPRRAPPRFW